MAKYTFRLDSFDINNTRARHNDTDYVAIGLKVGDKTFPSQVWGMGDLNNGHYPVGIAFENIDVYGASTPVTFNFQIVNSGHSNPSAIENALTQGALDLMSYGATALGDVVLPGTGSIWGWAGKAAGEWLAGIIFADCDGAVAIDQVAINGATLKAWTAQGIHSETRSYPGTDSPVGCGSNSEYNVTWSIERTSLPDAPSLPAVFGVSRSQDKLDIFVTDVKGQVLTAAWQPDFTDGWHGWWQILNGVAALGSPITAVCRSTNKLDIFSVGTDGGVYTAAWQPDFAEGWHGWWRILNGLTAPGSPITAVCRSTNKLDIFSVGTDGGVYTAAWQPDFTEGWHGWWRIGNIQVPLGSYISAVSRSQDKLDIFVTDVKGQVLSAAWQPDFTDGWHGWWQVLEGLAAPGSPITAVSRSTDKLDIFSVGTDGGVYTAAWEPDFTDGWHGWSRIGNIQVPLGSYIGTVSRSVDKLDIFATDIGGRVLTAAWQPDFTDGWHGWWQILGGLAAPGFPITAVCRSMDKLNVFSVGTDGGVYTAAWEPGFTDGWHGWWRIGDIMTR
jgi:hypothetical protein